MLSRAFDGKNAVSQGNYEDIVRCMRAYDGERAAPTEERAVLASRGWPITYHPCDHMERVRFCMTFDEASDSKIDACVRRFGIEPSVPGDAAAPSVIEVFQDPNMPLQKVQAALAALGTNTARP